jgi:uncharacterized protein (TIGR03067 family)
MLHRTLLISVLCLCPAAQLLADEPKSAEAVPAEEFMKLYATDPKGFDAKYAGKVVTVEGPVSSAIVRDGKNTFLMLRGYTKPGQGQGYRNDVRVVHTPEMADLRMGLKVRIRGTCQPYKDTIAAAELRDAKLVKVLSADYPPKKAAKEEIAKLQGRWKVTKAEVPGEELKPADVGFEELTFDGFQVDVRSGNRIIVWGVALDPAKSPKAVDFVNPDDSRLPLIYSVDRDTLKLGVPPSKPQFKPEDRPAGFDLKANKVLVLTAERAKEKK